MAGHSTDERGRLVNAVGLVPQSNCIEALENIGQAFNQNLDTVFNVNINAAEIPSIKYIDVDQVTLPGCKPEFDASDYAPLATHQLDELKTQTIGYKRDFEKIQAIF